MLAGWVTSPATAEDGYELWLRYHPIDDAALLHAYRAAATEIVLEGDSPTLAAAQAELARGLAGLLGRPIAVATAPTREGAVIIGTPASSALIEALPLAETLTEVGDEGYMIRSMTVEGRPAIVIAANEDVGVLYGSFHLLRLMQTHESIDRLNLEERPRVQLRMLNHWDNLDRTVERGYAGFSLWDWHRLPHYVDPRYIDYARANASIGINGASITNVNANADVLRPEYLNKAAALADAFRPYGIRVYLTARFSAPMELGGLRTADPLDAEVRRWWEDKAAEIYEYVPDFGGFLVKADSEGQPGPYNYGRTHAEGANMLADALAPHGGLVIWRAFVYSDHVPVDRIRQAYDQFKPLDGLFRDNVMVQVKNGPLDFQPREPFHPLFGGMPGTPLMMEFQITQEYLGQGTHLAYLAPLYKEVLDSDTFADGPGSTVARVVDGSLHDHRLTGMAGVANTGTDRNWTGGHFHQANWYAFGRLAWDHRLSPESVAEEWARATFSNHPRVVDTAISMMMASREAVVNYTGPLGLHHLMAANHHHGPGPWVDEEWDGGRRADWTATYYHRADNQGIGFDRTAGGSGALDQYHEPLASRWSDPDTTPDELLLFFHRVRWTDTVSSGRTLWDELAHRYYAGVDTVRWMRDAWRDLEGLIDDRRFSEVDAFLAIQEREASWWRDASVLYFQTFSAMPVPKGLSPPEGSLDEYKQRRTRYVPGI
ncbi:MAG: alpha-glucuronidase family glycosyl hydrolase [Bacteroidota bacterium]